MSADGEIEVAVKAEGVDDAAQEIEDGDGTPQGGGDGQPPDQRGDGEGGLSGALRAGAVAGLLMGLLGPLLDVLDPIQEVLEAFLAPIAAMMLRQLAPVLDFLIRLLPGWFDFVENFEEKITEPLLNFIADIPTSIDEAKRQLPGLMTTALSSAFGWLSNGASNIGAAVWDKTTTTLTDLQNDITSLPSQIGKELSELPDDIGAEISRRLSGIPGVSGPDGGGDSGSLGGDDIRSLREGSDTAVNIALSGGLDTLVERIEANPNREGSP